MRLALVMLALLAAGHGLGARRLVERTYSRIPGAARGAVWAAMVAVLYFGAQSSEAFIYFQF